VRSRALAEATALQARAEILCRIAIESREDIAGSEGAEPRSSLHS
jgi:hypothetical protein